ncbi:hypothetical protein Sp245p_22830 (plasmid) [Azospirillum baldaniorum]|uniref:Uncharacterized protein n=1 Tax=Azospirillum baldaniorum TaxID=1064539 RepID=A0A9P1JZH5_9PROT|nr:hypothetical protein Sp245p_22830 [Azospirillum baldaniorum]TWA78099.1 hypothetical protein FBZ85_106259 [Azospirillum brasilense]CCD02791.1 protein of unknown function [Azospirillum baldaniorum]
MPCLLLTPEKEAEVWMWRRSLVRKRGSLPNVVVSKFRFTDWTAGLQAIAAVRRSAVPVTGNLPLHNPFSRRI